MNLVEIAQWETGIYQLETTDLVLGGLISSGGISNLQAQLLANRTAYLKDLLGRFASVLEINVPGAVSLNVNQLRHNHVVLSPASNGATVTLTGANDLPDGAVISISISALSATWGRCLKIACPPGLNYMYRGGGIWDNFNIYLYTGEAITLIKAGPRLLFASTDSNIYDVGEIQHAYKPPVMSIEANGQLISRASYPRLWAWLQTSGGGAVVSEATYSSNPLNYSGVFTTGNGSTTFRVPDLRSMFIRGLDNGRGLDLARPYNAAGGYEADEFKQHQHQVPLLSVTGLSDNADDRNVKIPGGDVVNSSFAGGAETRPKNVGYTAYIKY